MRNITYVLCVLPTAILLAGCWFGDETDVATTSGVAAPKSGALAVSGDNNTLFVVSNIAGTADLLRSVNAATGALQASTYASTGIIAVAHDAASSTRVWALHGDGWLRRHDANLAVSSTLSPMPALTGTRTLCDMDQALNGDFYVTAFQSASGSSSAFLFRRDASTGIWSNTEIVDVPSFLCPRVDVDEVTGLAVVFHHADGLPPYGLGVLRRYDSALSLQGTVNLVKGDFAGVLDITAGNGKAVVYGYVTNDATSFVGAKIYAADGTIQDSIGGYSAGLDFAPSLLSSQAVTVGTRNSVYVAYFTGSPLAPSTVTVKSVELLQ